MLVIAHQIASVIVTVARIPLIPASKKVVIRCPLSVDNEADCACWLGSSPVILVGQEVTMCVIVTTAGKGVAIGQCCLQDTPATPMCLTSLRPPSKVKLLVAQSVIRDSLPVHLTLLNRTVRLGLP